MCWEVCCLVVAFTVIIIMFIEEEANMIKQMLGQMYSTSLFQHYRPYKTHHSINALSDLDLRETHMMI